MAIRSRAQAGFHLLATQVSPIKAWTEGGKRGPSLLRKTNSSGQSGGLDVPSHGLWSWTGLGSKPVLVTACYVIMRQSANLFGFTFAIYKMGMSIISVSQSCRT